MICPGIILILLMNFDGFSFYSSCKHARAVDKSRIAQNRTCWRIWSLHTKSWWTKPLSWSWVWFCPTLPFLKLTTHNLSLNVMLFCSGVWRCPHSDCRFDAYMTGTIFVWLTKLFEAKLISNECAKNPLEFQVRAFKNLDKLLHELCYRAFVVESFLE